MKNINEDYTFDVGIYQYYGDGLQEKRFLYLPKELVQGYAIEEGNILELFLEEVIRDEKVERMYSNTLVIGSTDVEPKNQKNELDMDKNREKDENISSLKILIKEGELLRDRSPMFGQSVSLDGDTLTKNQLECHKWVMRTNNSLIRIFGEDSQQSKTFMAHFKNEYFFGNLLGTGGTNVRYFYDNIGAAIVELEVFIENFDAQLNIASKLTLNNLFNAMHFHPEVVEASQGLFKDGHYSEAILNAFIALNASVKEKSGVTERDGFDLMNHVFNEERPILRLNELRTITDVDEQKGFRFIYAGAMAGIRNPKAHNIVVQKDPYKTFEYLALASLLFRRLDEAKK